MIPTYENTLIESFNKPESERARKVYKIDWDNNRLLSRRIDGKEAVEQAVQVYTAVEYQDFQIMPDNFGIEMKDMYGMPRNFVKANLERKIKEALSIDSRIERAYNFVMTDLENAVLVEFVVDCVEGTFKTEVELKVV